MIEAESKGNIQASEDSPQGLISNASYYGNTMQVIPQHKNGDNTYAGETMGVNNMVTWEPYPYRGYGGPYFIQETFPLPCAPPNFQVFQHSQMNIYQNNFYAMNRNYPFPVHNQFCYMPSSKMLGQAYPSEFQAQEFQYFVVIDFEATCDKIKTPEPQEIIEFPSVLVNSATGQLEDHFQLYVCPAYHRQLTDFCKELTGIQQNQVDNGVTLDVAIMQHDMWLETRGIKHKNFAVVTWSNWDCRVILDSECRLKKIRKPPYFNRWINLRVPFQKKFGDVRCNLKEAVELAGLTWEGRQHSGLDDAFNTARLLVHLMRQGIKFSITNSITLQAPDSMKNQSFQNFLFDQNQRQHHNPKELAAVPPVLCRPPEDSVAKEKCNYCFCGVLSSKGFVRKPGPNQGKCFYGCGNWTATRRAACNYFVFESP